jgi:hypothetical protein
MTLPMEDARTLRRRRTAGTGNVWLADWRHEAQIDDETPAEIRVRRAAFCAAFAFVALAFRDPAASQSVSWTKAAIVPRITFQNAFRTRAAPALVEWSFDGSSIISLPVDFLDGWLMVHSPTGQVIEAYALPGAPTYHELISSHVVIMPGDMRVGEAFVVEDAATAEVIFREMDPAPGAPGSASGTVRFALPADKSVVAVGYGFPRGDQPVTLYDTRDWRKLATLVVPAEGPTGVGKMTLSDDRTKLAYASSHGLVVVDARTGTVIRRLPVVSGDFAFSADGRLLAVAAVVPSADGSRNESSGLHVYRLPDGVEVASISPAGSPYLSNLRWDRDGRFLVFMSDSKTVHFWNPGADAAKDVVIQLLSNSRSLSLSPNGKQLAVGDGDAIDLFEVGD